MRIYSIRLYLCLLMVSGHYSVISAENYSPLPEKLTNNAVAALKNSQGWHFYSFNGLGESRSHQAVQSSAWVFNVTANKWSKLANVPDSRLQAGGRLASIAAAVAGKLYLFGGYTVAADDSEISTPETNVYDPVTEAWSQLADMPVAVDDSVALVYRNRFIYLISGWHNDGNVSAVQVLDTKNNSWSVATDFPGSPVFGHAAGIIGNKLIVANGVKVAAIVNGRRQYQISEEVWQGTINNSDNSKIKWHKIAAFPGGGRYRMAAVADHNNDRVYFVGGSLNPYNYNGIGYNGIPSEPEKMSYAYDTKNNQWLMCGNRMPASMDHRGLVNMGDKLVTIGGMLSGQQVTGKLIEFKADCHRPNFNKSIKLITD